ncbi:hypothetical protein SAMN05444336_11287 [Albimonas donghaensis]|uniref:Uncharacterized protein n=1 Tax=Albimonas donghaensis TaxID=356660 RepID=A0A1H3FFE6_9RHOB|nr:hypothetical protein [Albimonas donghaensis]SDX89595.1 hypothetical protein SAMN05444336_11287 [Albimonas donghaensis]
MTRPDPEAACRGAMPPTPTFEPEPERLPLAGLMVIAFAIALMALAAGWALRGWWGA